MAMPGARVRRAVPVLATLLALFAPGLMPGHCRALPLFSRAYAVACSQCHLAGPRLNAFGMRFLQDGYRMRPAHGEPPAPLPRNVPLSVVANAGISLEDVDRLGARRAETAEHPFRRNGVELEAAGNAGGRVTFHLDHGFGNRAGMLERGTGFVQLDDVLRRGALNLKVGAYDADVPYLSSDRRTTLHPYLSPVTLEARGVELNGSSSGLTYAAGLMASHREQDLARLGSSRLNRLEDTYVWLMEDLSGQKLAARMWFDRQDSNLPGHSWLQHLQAEFSSYLDWGRFAVIPAYIQDRFDDRPVFKIHDKRHRGLLEAIAALGPERRWMVTARYEHEYHTRTPFTREEDHQLGVLGLGYTVTPNARIDLEWARTTDNLGDPRVQELDASVQLGY